MKNSLSNSITTKLNFNDRYIREFQNEHIIVKSGIKELDKYLGGFKPGEINFIHGDKKIILNIPYSICANTYKTCHKNAIYIDGGMSFNPYSIARYARKMELDQREILSHIYISRAFTLFQLTDILQYKLEEKIIECNPKTVIIGKFLDLYFDSSITSMESNILMRNNLKKIKEITKKYGLVTILSNFDKGIRIKKTANRIIYEHTDQIVKIKQIGRVISFNFEKKNNKNSFSIIENNQLSLDDFELLM